MPRHLSYIVKITLRSTIQSFFIIQLTYNEKNLSHIQKLYLSICLPSLGPHVNECVGTRQHMSAQAHGLFDPLYYAVR